MSERWARSWPFSSSAEPELLRQTLEFLLARWALAAVDRLSFDRACRLGRGLARIWWLLDRPRRRVAIANIVSTGIEPDRRRARRLGRRSAEHFGIVLIEALKSAALVEEESWREHLELEIAPDVMAVLADPEQALIMVSGHLGNWEIAAHWLSRFKPVAGITRPMNNPRVEELVQARKSRYRFHPIPKYGADAKRLVSVLNQREILALLTDQHARTGAMAVEFFGRPAATYTTPAMLHLVTRTPLCFASCRRIAPKRFALFTSPLIRRQPTGDRKRDAHAIMTTLNGLLEAEIRKAPEQYLWVHRRWRDA